MGASQVADEALDFHDGQQGGDAEGGQRGQAYQFVDVDRVGVEVPQHGSLLAGGFDELGHFQLLGADGDLQGFEYVLGRGDGAGLAAIDESVGPAAGGGEDAAGDGQDFAVLLDGVAGGVEGAALERSLADDGGEGTGR